MYPNWYVFTKTNFHGYTMSQFHIAEEGSRNQIMEPGSRHFHPVDLRQIVACPVNRVVDHPIQ